MIDELRRKEAHSAELTEKDVFKGVRYLLLKGQESIENDYKAKYRLHRLLEAENLYFKLIQVRINRMNHFFNLDSSVNEYNIES